MDINIGYDIGGHKLTSLHSLVPTPCKYNTTTERERGGEDKVWGKEEKKA